MSDVTLFCRTYKKDAPWFVQFMRSYVRFGENFPKLVVHCDHDDEKLFRPLVGHLGKLVAGARHSVNGYINQQIVKLHCDLWVKTPYVLFIDSDYVMKWACTRHDFIRSSRPIVLMTPYDQVGDAICWKEPTEEIARMPVGYEYMRAPKLCYHTDSFTHLRDWIRMKHNVLSVSTFLAKRERLSEFNLIGWYIHHHEESRYRFLDTTKDACPPVPFRQFWSYGGITPAVQREIEEILANAGANA